MNITKKYAVFIDGDNISPRYLEAILSEVSKDGDILIRRIYGDWTTTNMNGWKDLLLQIPVRPVQQFRNGSQATDNAIIMDAIELANTNKEINAMCIVSSDTDYYSLALKIREYGLFVLGMGAQKSSSLWIKSCNQFIHLENLSTIQTSISSSQDTDEPVALEKLLANAYANSRKDDDGWVSLSNFGTSIRNIMPDFDPRSFNHETLRALIAAMPELYQLDKDNLMPPNYWVKPTKNKDTNSPKLTGTIKKWLTSYGFIKTAEGDFYFTNSNILPEYRAHKIRTGDKVEFEVFQYPNPNGNKTEQNGRAANICFLEN